MNLYEINAQLEELVNNSVDPETGEISEDALAELEALSIARDEKIENIALFIKNLKSDADAIKAEKQNLDKRAKSALNKAKWLEEYLKGFLEGQKFSTAKVAISYRKSSSVECDDWTKLSDEYLRYKEPEIDKVKIKDALKNGEILEGCRIVENVSMTIK